MWVCILHGSLRDPKDFVPMDAEDSSVWRNMYEFNTNHLNVCISKTKKLLKEVSTRQQSHSNLKCNWHYISASQNISMETLYKWGGGE